MFKQILNRDGSVCDNAIIRVVDGASIPFDPANTDFLEYQKWLREGNIPLPADEPSSSETV